MKVRIDEAACEGRGGCFAIAPALFELDELGTSSLIGDGSVSPADEELVRLAAANCPEFAIGISGEHYDVVHTVVGISESRRTESFWTQSAITPAGGGTTIATVLLHQGVFEDSYPDYPREAADAPA